MDIKSHKGEKNLNGYWQGPKKKLTQVRLPPSLPPSLSSSLPPSLPTFSQSLVSFPCLSDNCDDDKKSQHAIFHSRAFLCLFIFSSALKKIIFVCATKMQMKHFLDIFLVSQSLTELFLEKEA